MKLQQELKKKTLIWDRKVALDFEDAKSQLYGRLLQPTLTLHII